MAEDKTNVEKGEYVIGIAIILAALLVCATVWISSGNLVKALGAMNISAAAAQPSAAAQAAAPAQQAAAADWSFVASMPYVGPANAKVTVIEFADFQCPYCGVEFGRNGVDLGFSAAQAAQLDPIKGAATKITNEYAKGGKSVKFVYVPMAFLGQESVDAANAALCARDIGGDAAFFTMHDALFTAMGHENSGTFTKDNLKAIGAAAGFNSTAFTSCIDSGKHYNDVTAATSFANSVGVQGTPTVALNNKIISPDYATIKSGIDAALAG